MVTRKIIIGFAAAGLIAIAGFTGCSKSKDSGNAQTSGTPGQEASQQAPGAPVVSNAVIVEDLKSRLKEKPNDPEVLWRLGDAYFDSKQFAEAADYYKKAIQFKPDETDIYNDLGLSVHYLGKSDEGLKYVEVGIKKNPYHQRIWLTKGFILAYGMGDLQGAKAAWEKAAALNPESQIGKAASEFLAQFNEKAKK
ncbi:MAG: tetratricopeptide repeat protein [Deltaproteobacteria bacterium]|nr:tetratricopeptide repeat protein [Deltaproteobacteria bacterium]